jgi:aldehyde dehydrogenase (NAD+)
VDADLSAAMTERPGSHLFIDGRLRPASGGRSYDNIGPATGEAIGQGADAVAADVDAAIASARRAFDHGGWARDRALRVHCLTQLRDQLRLRADAARERVAGETGAPLGLTYGYQLDLPIRFMDWTIALARDHSFERDTRHHARDGHADAAASFGRSRRRRCRDHALERARADHLRECVAALARAARILKAAPETPGPPRSIGEAAAATDLPSWRSST